MVGSVCCDLETWLVGSGLGNPLGGETLGRSLVCAGLGSPPICGDCFFGGKSLCSGFGSPPTFAVFECPPSCETFGRSSLVGGLGSPPFCDGIGSSLACGCSGTADSCISSGSETRMTYFFGASFSVCARRRELALNDKS